MEDEISDLFEAGMNETVTIYITKCGIYGPAGAGKTNLRSLILNKPRPKTRESTDILSEVDLVSPDLTEDIIDVQEVKDGSVVRWYEVNDRKLSRLLANTIFDEVSPDQDDQPGKQASADQSSSHAQQQQHKSKQSLNEYKIVKQVRKLLKEQLAAAKSNGVGKKKRGRKRRTLHKIKLVHLVDCGGQSQFQEVIPMFARNSSAHLLVHPLHHDLDDIPPFQYEVCGVKHDVQQKMQLTHRDIIYRSVRSVCSSRYRKQFKNATCTSIPEKPHIAVVGMFKDHLTSPESTLEEKHKCINECLHQLQSSGGGKFEIMTPTRDLTKPVFAFDGSENGWATNGKELDKLRQFIGDEKRMITVDIPVRWFLFLEILKEYTGKKKYYLTLENCKKIAHEAIGMLPDDVEDALELFDELNLILYYPNIVQNIVFIKPGFLYRKTTEIIVTSFTNSKDVDTAQVERQRFHDNGIFSIELLQKTESTKADYDDDFKLNDFLKLLQGLHIISPVGEKYFMPCVLPLEKSQSALESELKSQMKDVEVAGPLFVSFAEDSSPQGLFCATVTCLAEMPIFSLHSHGRLARRRNLIEFTIQEQNEDSSLIPAGSMIVWDKMTHFEIFCTGTDKEILPQVRKDLTTAISKASSIMHYSVQQVGISIGFECKICSAQNNCHGTVVSKPHGRWSARCLKNSRQHPRPLQPDESCWYTSYSESVEGNSPAFTYTACMMRIMGKYYVYTWTCTIIWQSQVENLHLFLVG